MIEEEAVFIRGYLRLRTRKHRHEYRPKFDNWESVISVTVNQLAEVFTSWKLTMAPAIESVRHVGVMC